MHAIGATYPKLAPACNNCAAELKLDKSRLLLRPLLCCGAPNGFFRDGSATPRAHRRLGRRGSLCIAQSIKSVFLLASEGPRRSATTTAPSPQRSARPATSTSGGGKDPEDEPDSSSDSFQIGLDPFSQQLIASAVTAVAAWAIATWANLDLSSSLRPEVEPLALALQLSAPVLVLLLAVVVPRWAPPYKGSELSRLRHNYYMTAQVLRLYLDLDDEDDEGGSGSGSSKSGNGSSSWDEGGGGAERARVRRRLRLEQTVGWGTICSGLALMQAYTLQPWNPPTANSVFGLALAGRTAQQLANEFLIRGAGWGLLSSWVAGQLLSADASDGILFFGKVFGGPGAVKYAAGLALVALALPGALWEARAARNFVRASVVGPVRDAAIFCTGNGVDEPSYCDPRGFAMLAARRPANAAPVADVVTRTRGWRSGPQSSFSSVKSTDSLDGEEEEEAAAVAAAAAARPDTVAAVAVAAAAATATAAASPAGVLSLRGAASAAASAAEPPGSLSPLSPPPPTSSSSPPGAASPSSASSSSPYQASSSSASSLSSSSLSSASSASASASSEHSFSAPASFRNANTSDSTIGSSTNSNTNSSSSSSSNGTASSPPFPSASTSSASLPSRAAGPSSSPAPAPSASAPSVSSPSSPPSSLSPSTPPSSSPSMPRVGPTLSASSAAFEWDSEDMGVLLRVETLQDKIAFWSSLYYQLLAAFAINGAFLASDCNLLASFAAAWLLRTGPLLLSELRARREADAALR